MPLASAIVATMGKPSGIAATASAIPVSTIKYNSFPAQIPDPTTNAAISNVTTINLYPSLSSRSSSGVCSSSASSTSDEMAPSSVSNPVVVTTASPAPRVIAVPL